jgi:hypothetical protein
MGAAGFVSPAYELKVGLWIMDENPCKFLQAVL